MVNKQLNDTQILDIFFLEGKKEVCFKLLLSKYKEKTYWQARRLVVNHEDADDIAQTVWIKVWNKLETFRRESLFSTWIFRITANESLTFLRQKRNFESIEDISENKYDYLIETSSEWFDEKAAGALFQKAILTLPEKQRIVFNLKYFDELQYEEMSKITGTSVGALKASYHHAVKKIKDFLEIKLNV